MEVTVDLNNSSFSEVVGDRNEDGVVRSRNVKNWAKIIDEAHVSNLSLT